MEPINQSQGSSMIEARYRVMLILWLAMLSSVFMFFVMTKIVGMPEEVDANMMLVPIFMGLGLVAIALSFLLKRRFLSQAVEQQKPELVQTGMIVALALCEASALFGLIVFFVTGCHHYYVCFIVSLAAMLLHFPRRDQLRAASFKSGGQGLMAG